PEPADRLLLTCRGRGRISRPTMATKIRFLLGALAVLAPAWMLLHAADSIAPRATGRVLVLDNDRTLEVEIERQGDQYVIRPAAGETTLPASKALRLCADYPEAYLYLRSRTNLDDPDE